MKEEHSYRPYYDPRTGNWRVDFSDRPSEEGDLLYVAGEFAGTCLYFPYNTSQTRGREYSAHSHSFEGVIRSLLEDPEGFNVSGFEEYYSRQEREMLYEIRRRLLCGLASDSREGSAEWSDR